MAETPEIPSVQAGTPEEDQPSLVGSYPQPAAETSGQDAATGDEEVAGGDAQAADGDAALVGSYGLMGSYGTATQTTAPQPADSQPADSQAEGTTAPSAQPLADTPFFSASYGSPTAASIPTAQEGESLASQPRALFQTAGTEASQPPGIAASLVVPPLDASEAGEGGEWDLLTGKVRTWFDGAQLQERWESLGGPLRAAGLLLAAVVLLRLYSALLETLADLPLVPRLLQLAGLLSVTQFALTRLVRTSERERILTSWRERWNDFRGRD
jgi:hypothetical protein